MAQDLLVLSLVPDPESEEVCVLQLQSLQRPGVLHPRASHHILRSLRRRTDNPKIQKIQIYENVVACAISHDDFHDDWELEMWDWKAGTLLLRLRPLTGSFCGFALLSQSYLLLLTFDPALNSCSRIQQNNDGPDFVLKLMPFADHVDALAYLLYSRETASPDDNPPFEYDPDLTIITVFFTVFIESRDQHSGRTGAGQFLLIVPIHELIRNLDRLRASVDASQSSPNTVGPRALKWDEWGQPSTRLIGLKSWIWNAAPPTSRTRCTLAF